MLTIYYILLTFFLILSFFLVMLVLIQKGRGGGLSAAFGGVGGNTAFGAKTGDVLTWATSIVFAVFILLGIGLNLLANQIHADNFDPRRNAPTPAAATGNQAAQTDLANEIDRAAEALKNSTPPATQPASTQPVSSTPATNPAPTTNPAP